MRALFSAQLRGEVGLCQTGCEECSHGGPALNIQREDRASYIFERSVSPRPLHHSQQRTAGYAVQSASASSESVLRAVCDWLYASVSSRLGDANASESPNRSHAPGALKFDPRSPEGTGGCAGLPFRGSGRLVSALASQYASEHSVGVRGLHPSWSRGASICGSWVVVYRAECVSARVCPRWARTVACVDTTSTLHVAGTRWPLCGSARSALSGSLARTPQSAVVCLFHFGHPSPLFV